MCGGDPKCASVCPYEVITHIKNSTIVRYFETEDMLSPGTSLCPGCPAEVALRTTLRILGRNTILFSAGGCLTPLILGQQTKVGTQLAAASCLLGNVASVMTGVRRYYKHIGRDVNLVAFVGDGATADIGFQALSGAAERQENFVYICYDNEGYMNTGIQRSSTTPYKAWTTSSPLGKMTHGKEQPSKNMPLLMAVHGISYVATATVAFLQDYAEKLTKAMQVKDGMVYIHLYSPCHTGWRASQDRDIQISRLAVETNYFPLWEAEHGKIRITHNVPNPKPLSELTGLLGKFSHLNEEELAEFQQIVNNSFTTIKNLASSIT
jgi:pyruvate/2-oxoacid:ferredoxin oxidoreductase beta subunit